MNISVETMRTYSADEIADLPQRIHDDLECSFENQLIVITFFEDEKQIDGVTVSIDDDYTFIEAMKVLHDITIPAEANLGHMLFAYTDHCKELAHVDPSSSLNQGRIYRMHVIDFNVMPN